MWIEKDPDRPAMKALLPGFQGQFVDGFKAQLAFEHKMQTGNYSRGADTGNKATGHGHARTCTRNQQGGDQNRGNNRA
ncbi:hypothetical protein [Ruegeria arenilitoris]|uniref:hypothetical protein n=1 Tax=Ruegeria arenilitoris TaxID=1173585 RepID=UPI00147FD39A|nr:hypothetical protein [Ruegeria arenilitoris]